MIASPTPATEDAPGAHLTRVVLSIGTLDGRVYAVDEKTGKPRWKTDTKGAELKSQHYGFDRCAPVGATMRNG